ncbi:MAG: oxidoreductase [Verrucomicrobiales bacterium]|nr:oxidoreductase [Verrucomicrobiales bacterium]
MRFKDKVAIVTGAASGIGLAAARRFGSEGARVMIVDIKPDRALAAAQEVQQAGAPAAKSVECDVSRESAVEHAVAATIDAFGRWDVLVNNAGLMVFKPLEEQTGDDWWKVLNVDLLGAFYFTKQAFLRMNKGGAIVNVSSIHAVETTPLVSAYAAAKAALLSLTRSTSMEGKAKGIRANAILPGAVNTPMLWENPNVKAGVEKIDRSVLGSPENLAAVIAFLAADESEFVRGSAVVVDGGRLDRL